MQACYTAKNDTKPDAFLNEEQCHDLLFYLLKQEYFQFEVMVNLFLATGIPYGELYALHWDDINLETGLLYIRQTLVRLNGEYSRSQPQTSGSVRRIMLPLFIVSLLKEHKYLQTIERFKMGKEQKAPDAVFTNLSGNYWVGDNINVKLKKACINAGTPIVHVYSLRHTHASLLINSNITAKVIADRLGHSTTKTTLDTYSHVFEETQAQAMQTIDMKLFRKA